jgi:multiple sugar transport system substrate-binding protein
MKQGKRGLVRRWAGRVGLLMGLSVGLQAVAGPLNIEFGVVDAAQRAAFTAMVDEFKAANPDVDVHLTLTDLATYRKTLPGQLDTETAPDVFNWFAGDQMRTFAQNGQLEDLSELWKTNTWSNTFSGSANAATVNGKQYALPYEFYTWGLFFRHDVLDRVGLNAAPRDLSAMLSACSKLSKAGFIPVALGAKDGWALAAWFDYLDLRTNGALYHTTLTDGHVSYLDDSVRRTFMMWRQLIEAKCFAPDAVTTDVAGARAHFYQGHAGMILTGTNFSASIPEVLKATVDYARFPTIDPANAFAEAAPTDTFHIAARARDKNEARRFLKFAGTSAVNAKLARGMGSFPANKFAPVQGTVLDLNASKTMTDAKGGLVQAYDRDVPADMAAAGVKAMLEFLVHPEQMNSILTRLDASRTAIYAAHTADATPAAAPKSNKR